MSLVKQLRRYKTLRGLIINRIFIRFGWFNNVGKFKPGDRVKYNWMARHELGSRADGQIRIVTAVEKHSDGESWKHIPLDEWETGNGGDCFWIRKLHFWERLQARHEKENNS